MECTGEGAGPGKDERGEDSEEDGLGNQQRHAGGAGGGHSQVCELVAQGGEDADGEELHKYQECEKPERPGHGLQIDDPLAQHDA